MKRVREDAADLYLGVQCRRKNKQNEAKDREGEKEERGRDRRTSSERKKERWKGRERKKHLNSNR